MTYHGRELPGAEGRLIGTSEHGVLGQRWIYDGIRDPVLVAQLVALLQGEAEAQAQSVSSTPDPDRDRPAAVGGSLAVISSVVTADEPAGTELLVDTAGPDGRPAGQLTVRVRRILQPDADGAPAGTDGGLAGTDGGLAGTDGGLAGDAADRPCLSGTWRRPDGSQARGVLATARYTPLMAAPRLAE